jgi:uncharacterized protein
MSGSNSESPASARAFFRDADNRRWMASAGVLALGMTVGGYLLGNGLVRAREADRSVTVRGLAERDVTADLASWTLSYSSTAQDLATAQTEADQDSAAIRGFFKELGFPDDALQPAGVNVSQYSDNGIPKITVRQNMVFRSKDIARAQTAAKRQFDLVRRGVALEDGSGMHYAFTGLNAIKPGMIAQATKDARASAEQFANDSGTSVASIKSATQGYFSVAARDGDSGADGEGGGGSPIDSPYKRVRVVTTIDFYLR